MNYQTYPIPFTPTAAPASIIQVGDVRFTVLTDRLIRLEHDPAQTFEDKASFMVWFRLHETPRFEQKITEESVEIITSHLHLIYLINPVGFTQQTLSITLRQSGQVWHFGDWDRENLRGTGRTLDEADGPIHLDPGLLSRSGWAVIDDSASMVFDESGWVTARPAVTGAGPETKDLYFFGYGNQYLDCLRDYCKISGKVPMIPRYILGNWWSRYWEFSEITLKELIKQFIEHEIPLSVCIIDMDWHITKTGNFSSGWTGYTWNRDLFPDPPGFIRWLHTNGLRTALNLHPADGVHPHELDYPQMATAMRIDPDSQTPVPFDIADPEFVQHYFNILHHPKEEQDGIDFWWMDWQQGVRVKQSKNPVSRYLDPLFWLNHLHFYDLQRNGTSRGFVFSRWGGMGNHRYPIGFSGDSVVSWKSLAFQPYFTATSSNVAYSWWSHDIGGHMGGIEDPELYLRWIQFGVFSPILRLHCTKNPYQDRAPWSFGKETLDIAAKYMRLRHQLIPYLYTMAWKNYTDDIPLVQPMYYHHPEDEIAYRMPNQYYFGSQLLAAPVTKPVEPDLNMAAQTIWLPTGTWYDFFTGQKFAGERFVTVYVDKNDCPIFAKSGAIIPLDATEGWTNGVANPESLQIMVFTGTDGEFSLYEDDGISFGYANGDNVLTKFSLQQNADFKKVHFTISTPQGNPAYLPKHRRYQINFLGLLPDSIKSVIVNGVDKTNGITWDLPREMLSLPDIDIDSSHEIHVEIILNDKPTTRDRRAENIRKLLHIAPINSWVKLAVDQHIPALLENADFLNTGAQELSPVQMKAIRDILEQ